MKSRVILAVVASVLCGTVHAQVLPPDRDASANWKMAGMQSVGGIPNRTTICATVSPSGGDATAAIQAAVDGCPAGQVVSLTAGTFTIGEGNTIQLNKAVTLRGAGATSTILNRTNGATLGSYFPGSAQSSIINVSGSSAPGATVPLTADVAQGAYSVQVSNAAAYTVGEVVLLDEASGAGWQPDHVNANEQIWAAPDYRVSFNIHNPSMPGDDPMAALGWFVVHSDHPTNEMHQIASISGNMITFDSPTTISYRVSHGAQVSPMTGGATLAGIEDLAVRGGDNGNITFNWVAYAWAKNVDSSLFLNPGFMLSGAFRVQLEGIYAHNAVWPVPGGAGYNISLDYGTSEALIENSISMLANKVMVARASGAGSVVAYNYMDDGFISGSDGWVEIGLNASHLAGAHHVLFEGNWGFNADSDQTHGSSTYITYYRNWLTGFRTKFTDYLNNTVIDDSAGCCGPQRGGAAHAYAYWHSFVGNVIGMPGKMNGWVYNCIGGVNQIPGNCIWDLGMVDISPQGWDPQVASLALRDGNFDYLTSTTSWASGPHTLPSSLYLSAAPAFFGSSCQWPWVDGVAGTTSTLPAKARFDAGMPNGNSPCSGGPPPPPPPPPVIVSFSPNTGGVDTTSTITLNGTAEASSTVRVYDGGVILGPATVNTSGNWSFIENNAANGVHPFTATDTDANGTSTMSSTFPVTVNSSTPPPPTDLALSGTAFSWHSLSSATSNANKVKAPGLNDGNLSVDVALGPSESLNRYEAGGVVWSSSQTISSVSFVQGSWIASSGDGAYDSSLALQFTTNGTTWINSGWSVTPAYAYNSTVSGKTYTFAGNASATVLGFRIVGRVHTVDNSSWWEIMREVEAFK